MQHTVWPAAGSVQEGLQALSRSIVDAIRAEHIQLVQAQMGLDGSQCLHLPIKYHFPVMETS